MATKVFTCPACGSTSTRPAYGSALSFQRCRSCASVFDAEPPTRAQVMSIYEGKGYYVREGDDDTFGYADDYLADQPFIEAKFDRVLEHLERYVAPGRLLDVGAGPGFMVHAAEQRGWDAIGIDVNQWASEYAQTALGLDVQVGELTAGSFVGEHFDAITMMDLVEHVPDPDELLAQAQRLIRPGGALAILTPDAGSRVSRLLGRRWPEVSKPGEHMVLFSVDGLSRALGRHGFVATGWHSIGKTAPLSTLAADVAPAAPALTARVRSALEGRALGERVVEFDPRTKFCLYARRVPEDATPATHRPARLPRQHVSSPDVEDTVHEELDAASLASGRVSWIAGTFAELVPGADVLEVGPGIGTTARRLLDAGARSLELLEPHPESADWIERELGADPRVRVARKRLGDGKPHRADAFDLVLCQNVLEHIADDRAAMDEMATMLRSGGHLVLHVPAIQALFGALDDAYGHYRRYDEAGVRAVVERAGLQVESIRTIDALGIVGWWVKGKRPGARMGRASVRMYEAALAVWRPIEDRLHLDVGLSLVCIATKP